MILSIAFDLNAMIPNKWVPLFIVVGLAISLIASFQDNHNLYLVIEYMVGGDSLALLLREDILDERVA